MTFIPTRGRQKALASVRVLHTGSGLADLYKDDGAPDTGLDCSTTDWLELFSSSTTTVNYLEVFSDTGEILLIGTGPMGSEEVFFRVIPGGGGYATIRIPNTSRIVIKPEVVDPANGTNTVINFFD